MTTLKKVTRDKPGRSILGGGIKTPRRHASGCFVDYASSTIGVASFRRFHPDNQIRLSVDGPVPAGLGILPVFDGHPC